MGILQRYPYNQRVILVVLRMLSKQIKMASSWQRVLGGVRTVFSRFSGSKAAEVGTYSIQSTNVSSNVSLSVFARCMRQENKRSN